jgi:vitamin B12/bleomycin/antimicrobial peptide transport system ATP-binding/permease protein
MVDVPAAPRRRFAFLADAWHLAWPYFMGEDRARGRLLLGAVLVLDLSIVAVDVRLNFWRNDFYNSIQKYDQSEFWWQLGIFCILAAIFIACAVYQLYLTQMLQIRWRRWLTDTFMARWLARRTYWQLSIGSETPDNPDQRIAEDLRMYVEQTLRLSIGLLNAVVKLASFLFILWTLSGALTVFGITIPGYMLWLALIYAVIGTALTHILGRPLIALNFEKQRREADFRFSLVRFRENMEGIALLKGEAAEEGNLRRRFHALMENFYAVMVRTKKVTWLTASYGQAAVVFPYIMAAPRYFAKEIELGGLMQVASAFNEVQGALSYIVDRYTEIAEWRAVIERLTGFEARMAAVEARELHVPTEGEALAIADATVMLPTGRTLFTDFDLAVKPGEAVLLTGPSGSGKSTLFRVLGGLWPLAGGSVRLPDAAAMFLPQKPYLPVATLAQALSYPDPQLADRARLVEVLRQVKLGDLEPMLDIEDNWALKLSVGEQQRIALARALLKRPRWLFLDEASSALDEATEREMHGLLKREIPDLTLVSIGHRSSLEAVHDRKVALVA